MIIYYPPGQAETAHRLLAEHNGPQDLLESIAELGDGWSVKLDTDSDGCECSQETVQQRWIKRTMTLEETKAWTPSVCIYPLHSKVLCVAKTRVEGMWCAYCGPVRGECHDEEYQWVLQHGQKMTEDVARALWPQFKEVPYAR